MTILSSEALSESSGLPCRLRDIYQGRQACVRQVEVVVFCMIDRVVYTYHKAHPASWIRPALQTESIASGIVSALSTPGQAECTTLP